MTNRIFQRSTLPLVPVPTRYTRSFAVNSKRFHDLSLELNKSLRELESKQLCDVTMHQCLTVLEDELDVDVRWI